MGRSILVDEAVQAYIEELIKSNKWFTGVIIGQVTQQRDYVIHIARTPDPVEDEALEENGESDSDGKDIKRKQGLIRPSSLDKLDEKWVSTHAKQVSRMLPGGLSVIGLFALAPTSMLQLSQIKLKQMMFSVHKTLVKNPLLVSSNTITDRILLQIDSKTRKLTCSSLDVADGKSSPRPAEWKYQTVNSRWTRLDSQLSIDVPMTALKESKSQSLLKQMQTGLSMFCDSVKQAVVTIDGVMRDGSDPVSSQTERKGGKGKDKGKGDSSDNVVSKVKIFLPLARSAPKENVKVCQSIATSRLCGKITVRAFVPPKATVHEAIEAVRTDIVRSLYARCELLCEEDDVTEDKEDNSVLDPPIRFFCSSPNASTDFCDYAFQDEKGEEVIQRIQELLDLSVDQLESVETAATEEDTWNYLSSPSVEDVNSELSSGENMDTQSGVVKAYFGAAVGGLIAIIASGISYMYLGE